MSRRSKETLAVQLFPFLAVLVCTMGALIFLLLVTTREIRQRVVAFAAFQRAEQEQTLADRTTLPLMRIADPDPQPALRELPASGPTEPQEVVDDGYELARAQRERELSDLKATWRQQTNRLIRSNSENRWQRPRTHMPSSCSPRFMIWNCNSESSQERLRRQRRWGMTPNGF